MSQVRQESSSLPENVIEEAKELCRGAEVLPDGISGLASRIHAARQADRPLRAKFGIDPTSVDLHIGHAVVIRKLRRLQDFGHQVVLIIGGFTAQIGDPSGRNATRPPLTADQVGDNARTYLDQMAMILDMERVEVVNNVDWLARLTLNDMLKLSSFVTANRLLAKEAFGDRLERELPVGFHELFYPLLQGYDSIAVRADIELGGTDQRFNILQGRELQPHYGQDSQLAMLMPLLEGTDGVQKMSKSFDNYIGLKEPPDTMFGKCMRIPDSLIVKYFELTTTASAPEVDEIRAALQAGANPKDTKERLARQLVAQYHGSHQADQALSRWRLVHSERKPPDEMPEYVVDSPRPLFRLLVDCELVSGTGESKRLIQEGAVRLHGEPVKDPNFLVSLTSVRSMVLQVGRRKFIRLTAGLLT